MQDLMAAATGVNISAISDRQQKGCLSLTAQGTQQQKDNNEQTPPTFLVTQNLVSLLTEKGSHCYSSDRAEHEANGEKFAQVVMLCCKPCAFGAHT